MKIVKLKNKKSLYLALIFVFIILFLIIFLNKGLKEKALKIFNSNKEESVVDIVNSSDYSKYSGEVFTYFEGKQILDFSFLYKNDLKVKQGYGDESKWFKITDQNNKNNVTVYFTYEGGRGYSAEDYINNVLKEDEDIKILDVKFLDNSSSTIKYVLFQNKNSEYFVEEVKNQKDDRWLAIVENINAKDVDSQNIARDIIRSFEFK